jgi:hypothetical protein
LLHVSELTDAKSEEGGNATPQSGNRIKNEMKALDKKVSE